jgi:transcription elongation factor Elf1
MKFKTETFKCKKCGGVIKFEYDIGSLPQTVTCKKCKLPMEQEEKKVERKGEDDNNG